MKTKEQVNEMLNIINQQIKDVENLYENKSMSTDEYSLLKQQFEIEKSMLTWVLSNEWESKNLRIMECLDICFNDDTCQKDWSDKSPSAMHFEFELEAWFDVNEKFGLNIKDSETWVNLFAFYDPFQDELFVEYCIDGPDCMDFHNYCPTEKERYLIVSMIEDWCQKTEGKNPKEMIEYILRKDIQYYEIEFGKEKQLNDNEFIGTPDRFFICIKSDHYPTETEVLKFCHEDLDYLGYDAICDIKRLSYIEAHKNYNLKNEKEFPILKKGES